MKILVIGATGKTDELMWRKVVTQGPDVTVLTVGRPTDTKAIR